MIRKVSGKHYVCKKAHMTLSSMLCKGNEMSSYTQNSVYTFAFYLSVRILNVKEMYSRFMFLLFYILNKYIKR